MRTPEEERPSWNELLGPFFTVDRVSYLLGISAYEVRQKAQGRRLLGVKIRDSSLVFPVFQFEQNEGEHTWRLIDGLESVLTVFAQPGVKIDNWKLASWVKTPRVDLAGMSVIDYLKAGKGIEAPLAAASAAADHWSE